MIIAGCFAPVGRQADRASVLWPTLAGLLLQFATAIVLTLALARRLNATANGAGARIPNPPARQSVWCADGRRLESPHKGCRFRRIFIGAQKFREVNQKPAGKPFSGGIDVQYWEQRPTYGAGLGLDIELGYSMLTAVMLLLLPVIFVMSVWRTYTVPRNLASRHLRFSPKRPIFASITFVLVYCALLVNTLAVVYACSSLVWHPPSSFDELVPRLFPAAVYPFVYLSFEWALYHAVKTAPSA